MEAIRITPFELHADSRRAGKVHEECRGRFRNIVQHPAVLLVIVELVGSNLDRAPGSFSSKPVNKGDRQQACGEAWLDPARACAEAVWLNEWPFVELESLWRADEYVVVGTALDELD